MDNLLVSKLNLKTVEIHSQLIFCLGQPICLVSEFQLYMEINTIFAKQFSGSCTMPPLVNYLYCKMEISSAGLALKHEIDKSYGQDHNSFLNVNILSHGWLLNKKAKLPRIFVRRHKPHLK